MLPADVGNATGKIIIAMIVRRYFSLQKFVKPIRFADRTEMIGGFIDR
jgi:hypothetical protein